MFLASIYYTELSIFGLILSKKDITDFQRLECLYSCLATVKKALENFFKLPLDDYPGVSFSYFTQLARNIIVLYKLSTWKDPAWDTDLVRSTLDVLEVMDQLIKNIQVVRAANGEQSANGLLDRAATIFMLVRSWFAANLCESPADGERENVRPQTSFGSDAMVIDPIALEDVWLKDITYGLFEGHDLFPLPTSEM